MLIRLTAALLVIGLAPATLAETPVDLSGYRADCAVRVEGWNGNLRVSWPMEAGERGEVTLDLSRTKPLIQRLATQKGDAEPAAILGGLDPAWYLTVGERRPAAEKPPDQQWEVFFDNPHQRPHEVHASQLAITKARVTGSGQRATVAIDGLTVGPFTGSIEFRFFAGSRLLRIDAVISTQKDRLAVFYDEGLVAADAKWREVTWVDTEGRTQRKSISGLTPTARLEKAEPLKVRHRPIVAGGESGAVACFPPPHQFQFPRDYSTNLGFVWHGAGYQGQAGKTGFGIRQNKDGGGNFVPWFNAPPNTQQRMGMFLLFSSGSADEALRETLQLTNNDRFPELPGYKTFTSHYHMAIAVKAMEERAKGFNRTEPPDYVRVFQDMNVNMVHLGEFHGDGHPKDPGSLRLPEVEAMFGECSRWSDDRLLLIPGEEINDFLGLKITGKHPGHWMSLFPRPVYWTMQRSAEQPFVEDHPKYGKVYHVGDRGDMIRLLKEERGLAWSAHPRIKASSWTPDIFRQEDFYLADYWLGAAWKAMPGDLSRDKLGERVLNLLDDMANWGQKKYVLGEVDVFTIDHTHELFGHMNINYVQLDRVPRYADGWQSVLNVLRDGRFFVTTGEILLPQFTVGGKPSGDVLKLAAGEQPELTAEVRWTFPLAFAEVISGDGQQVYRERIDLADTAAFGTRTLQLRPKLTGRRWVRLEIWDIAANGAFTQPVWIE
ncbi:MAG TPA: hypothetical protein VFB80_23205 [Pirellulaceae bacterium]|nr:hypothetical protein [Pirellulaceae bacterium]